MRNSCFATLAHLALPALLILFTAPAAAVELGDIEVDSRLGMPFRATVPLSPAAGEDMAELFVDLASPNDYKALNVRRDAAINLIKAEQVSDSRGNRIELSSQYPMQAPYFTVVLKVRYQRATHFKGYPVTLDSPLSPRSAKQPTATPTVVVGPAERLESRPPAPPADRTETEQGETVQTTWTETETVAIPFKPFDGWARTGRYGPTVQGDMLRVIADRLRIDERYTVSQVMVALFEKNRSNFGEQNLNLPTPGSTFDVPTAAEVARLTDAQAAEVVAEHERRWRELQKQPRYAAIAEAQQKRYSHR